MSRTSGGRTMSGVSGGGSDVTLKGANAFTGTNTFNINRPTTTLTTTPASQEFITKGDGDIAYAGKVLQFKYFQTGERAGQSGSTQPQIVVSEGVPNPGPTVGLPVSPASNGDPDAFGGLLETMNPTMTLKSTTSKIIIDVSIVGEWQEGDDARFKQIILVRNNLDRTGSGTTLQQNLTEHTILYGAVNFENRMPTMAATITNSGGSAQFLDGYNFRFIDERQVNSGEAALGAEQVSYQPILTNGLPILGRFLLNATHSSGNDITRQSGCSTMTLTEVEI